MKLHADKEFLKKLLETLERKILRATLDEMSGKDASRAKRYVSTIRHYFYFLADRAMDDEEFAEELHQSIGELRGKIRTFEVILLPIAQILTARYQFGVEIDRERQRQVFEEDFKDMLGQLDLDRSREIRDRLIEIIRSKKREKPTNGMYRWKEITEREKTVTNRGENPKSEISEEISLWAQGPERKEEELKVAIPQWSDSPGTD